MINLIRNVLYPKRMYRFELINAFTGQREGVSIEARSEYGAVVGVRALIDSGTWLVGPAQVIKNTPAKTAHE